MKRLVGILEDSPERAAIMSVALARRGFAACLRDNAPDMIAWLAAAPDDLAVLSLDHDLGPSRDRAGGPFDPGVGRAVADWLAARAPRWPVVVHSTNAPAAEGMVYALTDAGWRAERGFMLGDGEAWAARVAVLVDEVSQA